MASPASKRSVGDPGWDIPLLRREAYHGWRAAVRGARVGGRRGRWWRKACALLLGVALGRQAVGVTRQPDVIGECGVAMGAEYFVGNAARAVAVHCLSDAGLDHAAAARIDETGLGGDGEPGAAETEIVADQVGRRHTFHARTKRQREALNGRDGVRHARLEQ